MSQNNSKNADHRKGEYKSWVVVTINHKPELVQSTWLPNYTPMHKATQDEALGVAIERARLEVLEVQRMVMDLEMMRRGDRYATQEEIDAILPGIVSKNKPLLDRLAEEESTTGYTSHGHPIGGVPQTGPRPIAIARCGGYGLCKKCSREANQARMAEANKR